MLSWNGVKRRALKSSWAIRGEVGGMICVGVPFNSGSVIILFARVSVGACSDDYRRSLQLGPEWTSLTSKPKSLLKGGNPSIIPETASCGVFHGSEI